MVMEEVYASKATPVHYMLLDATLPSQCSSCYILAMHLAGRVTQVVLSYGTASSSASSTTFEPSMVRLLTMVVRAFSIHLRGWKHTGTTRSFDFSFAQPPVNSGVSGFLPDPPSQGNLGFAITLAPLPLHGAPTFPLTSSLIKLDLYWLSMLFGSRPCWR